MIFQNADGSWCCTWSLDPTCSICGAPTSVERRHEEQPPEGEKCSGECDRWICESCTDWSHMAETNSCDPICKECGEQKEIA